MKALISLVVGQMSLRYTGLPSLPSPSGSTARFLVTLPASAWATTSGGEARELACTSGETRPSKLRLPERTAAATMPFSLIDFDISSGSGPELPMQVVQPKPTRLKPTLSSSVCRPELERYSATTWLPGASEVLTHGAAVRPLAAAFFASSPAPISTLGLEVLVQEVIAAITTSPWPRSKLRFSTG